MGIINHCSSRVCAALVLACGTCFSAYASDILHALCEVATNKNGYNYNEELEKYYSDNISTSDIVSMIQKQNPYIQSQKTGYMGESDTDYSDLYAKCDFNNVELIAICPPGYIVPVANQPCMPLGQAIKQGLMTTDYSDYYLSYWHTVPYGVTSFQVFDCMNNTQENQVFAGDTYSSVKEASFEQEAYKDTCPILQNIVSSPIFQSCPPGKTFVKDAPRTSIDDCKANKTNVIIRFQDRYRYGTLNPADNWLACSLDLQKPDMDCGIEPNLNQQYKTGTDDILVWWADFDSHQATINTTNNWTDLACAIYTDVDGLSLTDSSDLSAYNNIICVPGSVAGACKAVLNDSTNVTILDPEENNTKPLVNATVILNEDLTARYCIPYTLTYDNQGGSGCSSYTYTGATTASCTPTRAGYTFDGWCDSSNGTGNCAKTRNVSGTDKTLYAKWTEVTSISLSYIDSLDDTVYEGVESCSIGETFNLPSTPVKSGYAFIGWTLVGDEQ